MFSLNCAICSMGLVGTVVFSGLIIGSFLGIIKFIFNIFKGK